MEYSDPTKNCRVLCPGDPFDSRVARRKSGGQGVDETMTATEHWTTDTVCRSGVCRRWRGSCLHGVGVGYGVAPMTAFPGRFA
jgi:hypothetical protein